MTCVLTGEQGPGDDGSSLYIKSRALFVHPKPRLNQPISWLTMMPWGVSKTMFVLAQRVGGGKRTEY